MIISTIKPERVFNEIAPRVKKSVSVKILGIRDSAAFIIRITLRSIYSAIIENSGVRIKFPIIRIWIRALESLLRVQVVAPGSESAVRADELLALLD